MNDAYGQTDVMHDPNWLIANMRGRGPHDPVRAQMEAQLAQLQHQNVINAENQRLQESARSREQEGAQNRQAREDMFNTREQGRRDRGSEIDLGRQAMLAQKQTEDATRRTEGLLKGVNQASYLGKKVNRLAQR